MTCRAQRLRLQNSSVNFGKIEDVWCENLDLAESSPYKAMRLET